MFSVKFQKNKQKELLINLDIISLKPIIKKCLQAIYQIIFYFNYLISQFLWKRKLLTLSLALILGFSFIQTVFLYPKLTLALETEPISPLANNQQSVQKIFPLAIEFKSEYYLLENSSHLINFNQQKLGNTAVVFNTPHYQLIKVRSKREFRLLDEFTITKSNNGRYHYLITHIKEIEPQQILNLPENTDVVLLIEKNSNYLALLAKQL